MYPSRSGMLVSIRSRFSEELTEAKRPTSDRFTAAPAVSEALADRPLQDSERGPQCRFGDDRKAVLDVVADLLTVVIRRDVGERIVARREAVSVEVRERDVGPEVPRDLLVAFERDDVHGHVVAAHGEVVE